MSKKNDGPLLDKNFWDRIRRTRRRVPEFLREENVGQCTECGNIYPWSLLLDLSTQEYQHVVCQNCRRRHDERFGGHRQRG